MLFYDPYRRDDGCFGTIIALLVVALIIIFALIYIGFYVLIGFLILGAVIGGIFAVIAYLKAIPQAISDLQYQTFYGNAILCWLKRIFLFILYLVKYAVLNCAQYAGDHYQKFQSQRTMSFSKWMNLMVALVVIVAGIGVTVAMSLVLVTLVLQLILAVITLAFAAVIALLLVGVLVHGVMSVFRMFATIASELFPVCFIFSGRVSRSDILTVATDYFEQLKNWMGGVWSEQASFAGNWKLNASGRAWYSPVSIFSIVMWLMMPIGTALAILPCVVISFVIFLPVYIVDAIFLLIKSFF